MCIRDRNYSGAYHLIKPVISDLKDDYQSELDFAFIEKGKNLSLEKKYEVVLFPTLLLVWKEEIFVKLHGLINRQELYDHVDDLLIEVNKNR